MSNEWEQYREKIIGLGDSSARKSYYPELQEKIVELETSQTNLQTILDSTSDGIVIHDKDGKILSLNKRSQELFNIFGNFEKYTIFDISSKSNNDADLPFIWETVLNGESKTLEWIIIPVNKTNEIPVEISLNPTNWYGKKAMVAVVRDFSERKKYEKELLLALERAEESDRLKSVFLANLSHEIRTPLNAVLGFSDLLKESGLAEETRYNYIDIIQKSGQHLLSIITDIVEISKIETKQTKIEIGTTNINLLLDELLQVFQVISNERNIDLKVNKFYSDYSFEIETDEVKLRQILINLISNAFKFTEKGFVEVGYSVGEMVFFYVRDTGIGIKEKDFGFIFERFSQIESELSFKNGGSGLGLAISKAYVEMLGGNISVESEVGIGTTFKFSIPLKVGESEPVAPVQYPKEIQNSKEVYILVAEDDDNNFFFLSQILANQNFKILRAKNGKEAIDILDQNKKIKLVLMDIKMPVMTGYEAFAYIKKKYPDLPVYAQTAYALEDDKEKMTKAGFKGYITKPFDRYLILKTINQELAG
jgi:PAS domain S-box-containing protein